eukprot:TRINITY_DN271_c0_g1_i1.p1 TRINITY_DN271_c0_g1~~TRINITY_DN271_c0_g1_i1.p1  ORF type:complete len:1531 (+),score=456.43 TRINITY_DN271_c0_g1_i1:65-4657(+)
MVSLSAGGDTGGASRSAKLGGRSGSSLGKKRKQSNYAELERLAKKHNEEFHEITAFVAGVDKGGGGRGDDAGVLAALKQAFELRRKYQVFPTLVDEIAFTLKADPSELGTQAPDSSPAISPAGKSSPTASSALQMPSYTEFVSDLDTLSEFVASGPVHSLCHARLRLLEEKFEMHKIANSSLESQANQFDDSDFFSVMKADVSNQLASGMSAEMLIGFIRNKLAECPDKEVQPGRSLRQLFAELGITESNITLDKLGVQAPDDEWGGSNDEDRGAVAKELAELHSIFLSHDNHLNGQYFADLTRACFQQKEECRVLFEPRVPITGTSYHEFRKLAKWAVGQKLLSNVAMWAVHIPAKSWSRTQPDSRHRPSVVHMEAVDVSSEVSDGSQSPVDEGIPVGEPKNFREFLTNIFGPVKRASEDPDRYPDLASFLERVGTFAMNGDEKIEVAPDTASTITPVEWTSCDEPPYHWQMYYFACELHEINNIRRAKGMNWFRLRPVAGEGFEAGLPLMASYLLASGITNCVRLVKMPPLEYLFFLWQIGIALSFIGANRYHTAFHRNPIITHFRRGLNVCLCSGEPLRTHSTANVLIEEYSLFQKTFQLSTTDISEMARASVLQSSFPHERKCEALGDKYWLPGSDGNDPNRTNVADMRLTYRGKVLATEMSKIVGQDLEARDESWQLSDEAAGVTEPHSFTRVRVTNLHVLQDSADRRLAADLIREAVELRFKYLPRRSLEEQVQYEEHMVRALGQSEIAPLLAGRGEVQMLDGVTTLTNRSGESLLPYIPHTEFLVDYDTILETIKRGNVCAFSDSRIKALLTQFQIHKSMNSSLEAKTTGDFYSCAKVDNHIHMAAGMSSKELLEFIQEKVRKTGDDIVSFKSSKTQTLDEVYRSLGIDINSLTVDDLDVMADSDQLFHRFDRFNDKYNPLGSPALRECFLKTDNFMAGRYFAELCKRVLERVASDGYFTELRLSIYGRKDDEWDKLARWAVESSVDKYCNRWLIQVPRIYHVFRKGKMVKNFGQVLNNIFQPLWQVSVDPRSNWQLHTFLKSVAGFDSVDNEKITDAPWTKDTPVPENWESEQNPPYAYWLYYMYANIQTLNQFRRERGLTTFTLRPHCGESGAPQHLAVAFLLADGINHGINLRKSLPLQYLYYLTQLPVSCSPLSNNALFLPLQKNPFPQLFNAGLNMTLSTDDPLQFHLTQESLIEEYSIAAKLWKHSTTDLVEMARNSMLMSGFSYAVKAQALGPLYMLSSSNGNQRYKSRLSDIRVSYRYEALDQECRLLGQLSATGSFPPCFSIKDEEQELITRFALLGSLSPELGRALDGPAARAALGNGADWAGDSVRGSGVVAVRRGGTPVRPAPPGKQLAPIPSPRHSRPSAQFAMYFGQFSAPAPPADPRRLAWGLSPQSPMPLHSRPTAGGTVAISAVPSPTKPASARGVAARGGGIKVAFITPAAEGAVIMRTRWDAEAPTDEKKWELLRQCASKVISEDLPEYAPNRFSVLSRERQLLKGWDACIEADGEVMIRLSLK